MLLYKNVQTVVEGSNFQNLFIGLNVLGNQD